MCLSFPTASFSASARTNTLPPVSEDGRFNNLMLSIGFRTSADDGNLSATDIEFFEGPSKTEDLTSCLWKDLIIMKLLRAYFP